MAVPELPLEQLVVRAELDYVKAHCPVNFAEGLPGNARVKWNKLSRCDDWTVTIHDPQRHDLIHLRDVLLEPLLYGLEIAVDFWPSASVVRRDRVEVLHQTFKALAGRFRPEDKLLHGAGFKGAFATSWAGPKPFHRRLANVDEELVYGHRNEGQNAKLYLKTRDMGKALAEAMHRVRLETTLDRFGCSSLGLDRVTDLLQGNLRREFATVFRVLDRPEIRHPGRRTEKQLVTLQRRMQKGWDTAGVGAFASQLLPQDASKGAREAQRFRVGSTLSLSHYRLRRHSGANEAIGSALRNLDRRLRPTFSGGDGAGERSEQSVMTEVPGLVPEGSLRAARP